MTINTKNQTIKQSKYMLITFAALTLISLTFAPLGCFVLWKRYVYYSDGLAHSSMLAVAISIAASVNLWLAAIFIAGIFAAVTFKMRDIRKQDDTNNANIAFITSLMIACAIILTSFFPSHLHIDHLFFGDISEISNEDLLYLLAANIIVVGFLYVNFNKLILLVINHDIAYCQKVKAKKIEFLFLMILALVIFLSIKIIGSLLVTSILTIPPLAARKFTSSPVTMIVAAIIISFAANMIAGCVAFSYSLPLAACSIIMLAIFFFFSCFFKRLST